MIRRTGRSRSLSAVASQGVAFYCKHQSLQVHRVFLLYPELFDEDGPFSVSKANGRPKNGDWKSFATKGWFWSTQKIQCSCWQDQWHIFVRQLIQVDVLPLGDNEVKVHGYRSYRLSGTRSSSCKQRGILFGGSNGFLLAESPAASNPTRIDALATWIFLFGERFSVLAHKSPNPSA